MLLAILCIEHCTVFSQLELSTWKLEFRGALIHLVRNWEKCRIL